MWKMSRCGAAAIAFSGALLIGAAAHADGPHGDGHSGWGGHGQSYGSGHSSPHGGSGPQGQSHGAYDFHGHSINQFGGGDRARWTSGHWRHERHGDYDGWWWLAGGAWYFYPEPIYPYPDYVSSETYDEDYSDDDTSGDDTAGGNDQDQQPAPYWYYCEHPKGYYPYVRSCDGKWEPVPMTPPDLQDQSGSDDEGPAPDGPGYGDLKPPEGDSLPPPPPH